MVSNSAKLDSRTKQHTQFGVSASNGSRDMARTKSWQKEKKKKNYKANWMVSNSAKLDRRTKQHTEFGVSASNGSRDMARTKVAEKKEKKKKKREKKERPQSHKASPTGIANNITEIITVQLKATEPDAEAKGLQRRTTFKNGIIDERNKKPSPPPDWATIRLDTPGITTRETRGA